MFPTPPRWTRDTDTGAVPAAAAAREEEEDAAEEVSASVASGLPKNLVATKSRLLGTVSCANAAIACRQNAATAAASVGTVTLLREVVAGSVAVVAEVGAVAAVLVG